MFLIAAATLAFITLPAETPGATTTDRLCFVVKHPFSSTGPACLFSTHGNDPKVESENANPFASQVIVPIDFSFFGYAGACPIRLAFGADPDGDGTDELFVLRETISATGHYLLTIHPTTAFDSTAPAKLNASRARARTEKGVIGSRTQFGTIVAADGIDSDGDGRDEIVFVREVESGLQRLELIRLPNINATPSPSATKPSKPKTQAITSEQIGGAVASCLEIGNVHSNCVQDISAIDFDGDRKEELVVLSRTSESTQSLRIVAPPLILGEASAPLFSSESFASGPTCPPIIEVEGVDVDCDGLDEVLIRRRCTAVGAADGAAGDGSADPASEPLEYDHFEVRRIQLGEAGGTSSEIGHGFDFGAVEDAVVLRGPNPKPNAEPLPLDVILNDSFHGTVLALVPVNTTYYDTFTPVSILGPFHDANGKFDGTDFRLWIPGASSSIGGVLDLETGAITPKDPSAPENGFTFELPDLVSANLLKVKITAMRVVEVDSTAVFQGTFTGIAVNTFPTNGMAISGSFEFKNNGP